MAADSWSYRDAIAMYGIEEWSGGFFSVSPQGEVVVRGPGGSEVSLMAITRALQERELDMPVLLRFENILDARIREINESFAQAIASSGYQGYYRGAFPIKVNQQSHVIAEVARFGTPYHHGFEVGSKAELLVALATVSDPESLIICNGYKDAEFVDLGLQARVLGHQCFFVVENPTEVPLIIERSRALRVRPQIGVRVKLSSQVGGHWSQDSGDRSLFGLNTNQLVRVVDMLREADMLDCFRLLHYHLGSQIPDIFSIRKGIQEACRYYVELFREGAPLGFFDIGGGLAVDYAGMHSTDDHSRNYTLAEYCADIVEAVQESLDGAGVPHPVLISESGRAVVAHTAVLLFNVFDVARFEPSQVPDVLPEDTPEPIANLFEVCHSLDVRRLQEFYNDIEYYRNQVRDLFHQGKVGLRQRALSETLYLHGIGRIVSELPNLPRIPRELEDLQDQLADIYYGNFSVFQSLPDAWAIKQVFPVMPIHRLDERPTKRGVIADITCDCDGKLNLFSNSEGISNTLPLHPVREGDQYIIGVFLVGAYQETLGDLHNLFGDTNVASIRLLETGGFDVVHEFEGDSIADVLSYVEYDPKALLQQFRNSAEQAVREGKISVAQRQQMLKLYAESLGGYTYFEH